jgi:3',5'-cyclic AMP phosphodiesterase CpdA
VCCKGYRLCSELPAKVNGLRKLLHISDLHFGRLQSQVIENLLSQIEELRPDLLCLSGDLTQRATREQFKEASEFLEKVHTSKLVVPGNHDVPLWNIFDRFFKPFENYKAFIGEDLTPRFVDDEIFVQGLNTARSFTFSGGKIRDSHMNELLEGLTSQGDKKIKIVVSHHPVDPYGIQDRGPRGREVFVSSRQLENSRVDIYLCGHLHSAQTTSTSEYYDRPHHSAILIRAGTTTSSRLRNEVNSFNWIEIDRLEIRIVHYCYSEEAERFTPKPPKIFRLSGDGWKLN